MVVVLVTNTTTLIYCTKKTVQKYIFTHNININTVYIIIKKYCIFCHIHFKYPLAYIFSSWGIQRENVSCCLQMHFSCVCFKNIKKCDSQQVWKVHSVYENATMQQFLCESQKQKIRVANKEFKDVKKNRNVFVHLRAHINQRDRKVSERVEQPTKIISEYIK